MGCAIHTTNYRPHRHGLWTPFFVNNIFHLKNYVMAEIHVESRKHTSSAWIWILVSLIIIAAVAYFLTRNNRTGENQINGNPVSYMHEHPATQGIYYLVQVA
jgi:hypothetical protein